MGRYTMRLLALTAAAAALLAGSASAELSPAVAAPYLHIQSALAGDSIEGVADAAEAVAAAAAELGDTGAAIVMAARAVALADDLTKARAAFGLLSDAVIGYAREVGLGELRLAFCPMARKSWIQEDGSISNPYHGSEMLDCGSFRGLR